MGDNVIQETATRVRRIEARLNNLYRYLGINVDAEYRKELATKVLCDDGTLYCLTPHATVGDLLFAASRNGLSGEVPVVLGAQVVCKITC